MDVDYSGVIGFVHCQRAEVDFWKVDGAEGRSLIDVSHESFGDLDSDRSLSFFGTSSNVRGEDDVLETAEIIDPGAKVVVEVVSIACWLVGVDVDRGTSELSRAHGEDQCRDVDNAASAGVDQVAPFLHLFELLRSDHVLRLWQLGNMQGDEVGGTEKILEGRNLACRSHCHQVDDVVVDHGHSHSLRENRQLGTDVTVSNYTCGNEYGQNAKAKSIFYFFTEEERKGERGNISLPRVFPRISQHLLLTLFHVPWCISFERSVNCLAKAMISEMTSSATERELLKGELKTAIPCCAAYCRSTWLVPIQKHPTTIRFFASLSTRAVSLVLDRIPITCTSLENEEASCQQVCRSFADQIIYYDKIVIATRANYT